VSENFLILDDFFQQPGLLCSPLKSWKNISETINIENCRHISTSKNGKSGFKYFRNRILYLNN